ncbi:MAG: RNase A-like domain-containing protein [Candidatus Dormibacteria bacterium]
MDLDDGRDVRRAAPAVAVASPPLDAVTIEPLQVYELNGDGHTIRRHCDRTPGADAERLADNPWLAATGSFSSVDVAQAAVAECVATCSAEVRAWLAGTDSRRILVHDCGRPIGDVLRRADLVRGVTTAETTSTVLVVLRRHTEYPGGFVVKTAYPVRHLTPSAAGRTDVEGAPAPATTETA